MHITLNLEPEVEKGLISRAQAYGLTLDDYLDNLVKREAGIVSRLPLTGKEKAQAFAEWAKGHRSTKLLSDEAISRAAMYPDRA